MEVALELVRSLGPILAGVAAVLSVRRLRKENTAQHQDTASLLAAHQIQDAENFYEIRADLRSIGREIRAVRREVARSAVDTRDL